MRNKKLADDAKELDILQREFNLKQQQYYSDPNSRDEAEQFDRQDLNDTKTKIDDEDRGVAQDKQDISDLEDELRKAGGDPGWATLPVSGQSIGMRFRARSRCASARSTAARRLRNDAICIARIARLLNCPANSPDSELRTRLRGRATSRVEIMVKEN